MPNAEVLVVDDSMSARFALTRALQSYDLKIAQAKTAEEALDMVGQIHFDLIFMDHVLPGMNGLEAVEKIRQLEAYARTPIVMCTSNDSADYIEEARSRGATDVLSKPPQDPALQSIMANHLPPADSAPPAATAPATESADIPVSTALPETSEMNDDAKLQALDERIERLEQLMGRLEDNIKRMDARTAAIAKAVADQAGRDLANRLLRAVITLKGK